MSITAPTVQTRKLMEKLSDNCCGVLQWHHKSQHLAYLMQAELLDGHHDSCALMHAFVQTPPFECGQHSRLAFTQQSIAQVRGYRSHDDVTLYGKCKGILQV